MQRRATVGAVAAPAGLPASFSPASLVDFLAVLWFGTCRHATSPLDQLHRLRQVRDLCRATGLSHSCGGDLK
jgi:hypothetical protein